MSAPSTRHPQKEGKTAVIIASPSPWTHPYLVSGGVSIAIFAMQVTGDAENRAMSGRHPEVGRACVEDDCKLLWRRPQTYDSIILQADELIKGYLCSLVV